MRQHTISLIVAILFLSSAIAPRLGMGPTAVDPSTANVPWRDASLDGVTLGMSQDQVTRLWGKPGSRNAPTLHNSERERCCISRWTWYWRESFVDFDSTHRVVAVGSDGLLKLGHHVLDGKYNTLSSAVKSVLGSPTLVNPDHTEFTDRDWIYNGPGDLQLVFEMGGKSGVCSFILGHASFFVPDQG